MSILFGSYVREKREELKKLDKKYSIRQVAMRIGIEPSYLSKIERDLPAPLSEVKINALSNELRESPDLLLALNGKVSSDVRDIICKRPGLFSDLIRQLKDIPDHAVLRLVREVRDGNW